MALYRKTKNPGRQPKIAPSIPEEDTIHLNVTLTGASWNLIRAAVIGADLTPSQVVRVAIHRAQPLLQMLAEPDGKLIEQGQK
jgi:hypothetical protein